MNTHPNLRVILLLCLILFTFLGNYSCSKDEESFEAAILGKPTTEVDNGSIETAAKDTIEALENTVVEPKTHAEEDLTAKIFETRTTVFPAINDGYLQGDDGFDENIVRLEEGRRISYLMFNLSQIDSLGGSVDQTNLAFTIDSDNGDGTISVFKGTSNDWREEELSTITAPETDSLVGQLSSDYAIGSTHEVSLDTALVKPGIITLIMLHEDGDDLAFASKEHPRQNGPALIVSYSVPQDAEAIVFEENKVQAEAELPATETSTKTTEEGSDESAVTPEIQEESSEAVQENQEEEITKDSDDSTDEVATENDEETDSNASSEEAVNESTEEEQSSVEVSEESESDAAPEEENNENQEIATEETTETGGDTSTEQNAEGSSTAEEEKATQEKEEEEATQEKEEEEAQGKEEEEIIETETNSEADAPQNEAPRAVAEADNTTGNAPLKVNFTGNNSSDDLGVVKYVWDFRDGSTSNQPNPVHTFQKTGTLEVRLTVTDAQGESNTDTVTITIKEEENNAPPVAVAEASTLSGETPLKVEFTADGSADDGKIESYRWNFKDGNTAGSKNTSHTFEKAGTYQVELTVTDDKGLTHSKILTVTVTEKENEAPVAVANASAQSGYAPLEVVFNSDKSKDDKGIDGYFWDFKDGSTTTTKNPSHTFSDPGNYDVELSVKDEEGQTHATNITITVDQRPVDNGDNNDGSSGDTGSGDTGSGSNGSGDSSDSGNGNNGGNSTTNGNSGNYPSNAVFASSFGFNSGDATDAFQSALNSGSSYIVIDKQSSDWVIRPTSTFDLRNTTIVFEHGVILRAKSGAFGQTNDQLLQLIRANNVTIEGYGATFKMNKNEYSNGEHRHALALNKCKNVTVRGLTLQDSGGDGILIAGLEAGSYSEDITIEDVVAKNNKRLGMGIISAQDVWVRNSEFSNTRGTLPEAGVDLEPNHANERLVNINFINCKFSNNASRGFFLSTGKLNSSSIPISVKVTNADFSYNASGGKRSVAEIELSPGATTNPVRGEIVFEGARFNGSDNKIIFSKKSADSYSAIFRNCTAKDVAKNTGAAISLEALSTVNTLGGFEFNNFDIQVNSNATFMQISAPSSGMTLKDIQGDFKVRDPNDSPLEYRNGYNASKNVNVSIDYQHY